MNDQFGLNGGIGYLICKGTILHNDRIYGQVVRIILHYEVKPYAIRGRCGQELYPVHGVPYGVPIGVQIYLVFIFLHIEGLVLQIHHLIARPPTVTEDFAIVKLIHGRCCTCNQKYYHGRRILSPATNSPNDSQQDIG